MKRLNKSKYKVFIYIRTYIRMMIYDMNLCIEKYVESKLEGKMKKKKEVQHFEFFDWKIPKSFAFFCALYLWKKKKGRIFFSLLFYQFHVIICHNVAQTHKFNSFSRGTCDFTLCCITKIAHWVWTRKWGKRKNFPSFINWRLCWSSWKDEVMSWLFFFGRGYVLI